MAAISLHIDTDSDAAFRLAAEAARKLHYSVSYSNEGELALRRGSLVAGLLAGPFVPYCDFRMSIQKHPDGGSEIIVYVNKPWWSGTIGMGRVRNRAEELAGAIEMAVRESGGKVRKRRSEV